MAPTQTKLPDLVPPDNDTFLIACELPLESQLSSSFYLLLPTMGNTLARYILGTVMGILKMKTQEI